MDQKCPCEEEAITLQHLLRIALCNTGSLNETNIAVLYSLVKSILKKLNCEDEVVTVTGVKSNELQELLCQANRCPLPCDERLEVLTKELDKLEALEQQVEKMETQLNKHLETKFERTVVVETQPGEENSGKSQDLPPVLQLTRPTLRDPLTERPNINFSEVIGFEEMEIKHRSLVFKSLKSAASRWAFSPVPSTLATDIEEGSSGRSSGSGDCLAHLAKELKESFSAFKRRVEDNDGWWEYPNNKVCEEASAAVSAQPSETSQTEIEIVKTPEEAAAEATPSATSNATKDVFCCYVPCEDIFTIPAPELELPRALLKSTFFMQSLSEFLKPPFMRRIKKIEDNFGTMVSNLQNWITEVTERTEASVVAYENALSQLADVSFSITSNHLVLQDTLAGMQEIFDLKLDKCEIIEVKEELCDLFNRLVQDTLKLKEQLTQAKSAAFVYQTEEEKRKLAAFKIPAVKFSCTTCKTRKCEPHVHEPRLLQRIQFDPSDLTMLRERQHASYKPIRLTNSSNVLKDAAKQLHSVYKFANKSQDS